MNKQDIKSIIPHVFTSANLVSGFLSIVLAIKHEFLFASLLIILAGILDILDGHVARWLKVSGELGKELDSLADSISFVVAPALVVYISLLKESTLGLIVGIVIVVCGVLRLAKFNLLKKLPYFMGLPTPWFAFIVVAFIILKIQLSQTISALLFLVLALLMVSRIKLPNFK